MKRHLAGLTMAAALLAPVSSAKALGTFTSFDMYCGGTGTGGFCVQPTFMSVANAGPGLFRVTLTLTNVSGAGTGTNAAAFITDVGIDMLPSTITLAADPNFVVTGAGGTSGWTLAADVNGNGGSTIQFLADAVGGNHSFTTGTTATFAFNVTGDFTPSATNPAFYFKAQGLSSPPSIECETTNAGTFDGNGLLACTTVHVNATPEPASMTLLATGLVGIVGAARRRRNQA